MKLQWPLYTGKCDECGHRYWAWQKPWYKPELQYMTLWGKEALAIGEGLKAWDEAILASHSLDGAETIHIPHFTKPDDDQP